MTLYEQFVSLLRVELRVGLVLGLVVALAQSRWIQPLLFHQSATDPWILACVAGTMLAVAIAAGVAPAWRAARADPNHALRAE